MSPREDGVAYAETMGSDGGYRGANVKNIVLRKAVAGHDAPRSLITWMWKRFIFVAKKNVFGNRSLQLQH